MSKDDPLPHNASPPSPTHVQGSAYLSERISGSHCCYVFFIMVNSFSGKFKGKEYFFKVIKLFVGRGSFAK